jgi:hypothetical protein
VEGPAVVDAEAAASKGDAALAVTINGPVGEKTFILQTYVARDAELAELHALADKMTSVFERQQWKAEIPSLELALEADEKGLKAAEENAQIIEERAEAEWKKRKKVGPYQLNDKEVQQKTTYLVNRQAFVDAIAKKKLAIAELKKKIAQDG